MVAEASLHLSVEEGQQVQRGCVCVGRGGEGLERQPQGMSRSHSEEPWLKDPDSRGLRGPHAHLPGALSSVHLLVRFLRFLCPRSCSLVVWAFLAAMKSLLYNLTRSQQATKSRPGGQCHWEATEVSAWLETEV